MPSHRRRGFRAAWTLSATLLLLRPAAIASADDAGAAAPAADKGLGARGSGDRRQADRQTGSHGRGRAPMTASEIDDTPIYWWCAQAENKDSKLCRKLEFKRELMDIEDAEERARVIAARRAASFTQPSKEEVREMREDERRMLGAFCARPERVHHPACVRPSSTGPGEPRRTIDVTRGQGAPAANGPGFVEAAEPNVRAAADLDAVHAWWCEKGGHPDPSAARESIICASWHYRTAMRAAAAEAEKQALVDGYRAFKESKKDVISESTHSEEQTRMMEAYCGDERRAESKVCVKWRARRTVKQEL